MRSLLLVLCLAAFAKTFGQSTAKYSRAQADSVVVQFSEALQRYHPFPHRGRGRYQLDSATAVARALLAERPAADSLFVGEVIAAAGPIRAVIGDGHLQLRPVQGKAYQVAQAQHRYELLLRRSGDGALFLGEALTAADSTVLPKGARLLTLESRPIEGLVAEISAFTGVDDHDLRSAREFYPAHYLMTFYQRAYGWHDSLRFTALVDADTAAFTLLPVPVDLARSKPGKVGRRRQMADNIRLDTTRLDGVYRLEVASFSKSQLGKGNAHRRVRTVMKQLHRERATGLVLDLRGNTGGSAALVDHLYGFLAQERYHMLDSMIGYTPRVYGKNVFERVGNYLFGNVRRRGEVWRKPGVTKLRKPKRRAHFDGDLVVLTNEITFSGGSAMAHYVQYYDRGKVVGQTPGGSAERMFAGDLFEIRIGPRKEFRVNMPLWYMDMVGDARGNVRPDVLVPRTRVNQLDGSDAALEAALRLLQAE